MCGIVAYKGDKNCFPILLGGLKKLEYRGYDSAGISTINRGQINEQKCSGRVDNLETVSYTHLTLPTILLV